MNQTRHDHQHRDGVRKHLERVTLERKNVEGVLPLRWLNQERRTEPDQEIEKLPWEDSCYSSPSPASFSECRDGDVIPDAIGRCKTGHAQEDGVDVGQKLDQLK